MSTSLDLVLGAELRADAILSFSPCEYFQESGQTEDLVADSANAFAVPVFIEAIHIAAADEGEHAGGPRR